MRALTLLLLLLPAVPAAAQFWACPSPCPIVDATRLPDLLQAVQTVQQLALGESQLGAMAAALVRGVGAEGALFTPAVSAMPSLADMPSALSAPPLVTLSNVKQTLFQPFGTVLTSSRASALQLARAGVAAVERSAAMAASAQQTAALSALSGDTARAASSVGQAASLRGDVSSAAAVRLLLLADLANAARLVEAETALQTTGASLRYNRLANPG